jgi:hypothetical protein
MGGDYDPHDETAPGDEISAANPRNRDPGAAVAALDRLSETRLRRLETTLSSLEKNEVDRSRGERTCVPIWLQDQQTRPPPPPPHEGNVLWPRAVMLLAACGIAASLFYYLAVATSLAPEYQIEVVAGTPPESPIASGPPTQHSPETQDGLRVSRAGPESPQQGTLEPEPSASPSSPPATPADSEGRSFPPPEPPSVSATKTTNLQDVKHLLDRGKQFFEAGDLIAARILLLRAVIAGDAEAAVALGATYDPIVLADRGDGGIAADLEKARSWYERARVMGSPEGPRRLEMLANR